jgi:hypothetical protein
MNCLQLNHRLRITKVKFEVFTAVNKKISLLYFGV